MDLPFSSEQFFAVFASYNEAIWPAQVALYAIGFLMTWFAVTRKRRRNWLPLGLAILWLWMGIVYHGIHFSSINPAAWGFAVLFTAQALIFMLAGARRQLTFVRPTGLSGLLGIFLIAYALVVYPILGYALGHRYPAAPTFGLPCPTTIFTIGLLLCTDPRPRWWVLVGPLAWSFIGTMAAFKLGVTEDLGLGFAGVVLMLFLFVAGRRRRTAQG